MSEEKKVVAMNEEVKAVKEALDDMDSNNVENEEAEEVETKVKFSDKVKRFYRNHKSTIDMVGVQLVVGLTLGVVSKKLKDKMNDSSEDINYIDGQEGEDFSVTPDEVSEVEEVPTETNENEVQD